MINNMWMLHCRSPVAAGNPALAATKPANDGGWGEAGSQGRMLHQLSLQYPRRAEPIFIPFVYDETGNTEGRFKQTVPDNTSKWQRAFEPRPASSRAVFSTSMRCPSSLCKWHKHIIRKGGENIPDSQRNRTLSPKTPCCNFFVGENIVGDVKTQRDRHWCLTQSVGLHSLGQTELSSPSSIHFRWDSNWLRWMWP